MASWTIRCSPHRPPSLAAPAAGLVAALAAALLVAGCWRHVRTPFDPASRPVPASLRGAEPARRLDFDPGAVRVTSETVRARETARYRVERLRLPSLGDDGQPGNMLRVRLYRSKLPGRRPLVVVLPIWGSYAYPSRVTVERILHSSRGRMSVAWVEGERDTFDWPALLAARDEESFLERFAAVAAREQANTVDVRRLLSWATAQPGVDPTRLALVGFSRSAMMAAVVAAHEPRLAAVVLVMAGAHPGEAIANCPGGGTGDARAMVERRFGWSRQTYAAKLQPLYRVIDPASYPGRIDPARVLMFDAGADDCVPRDARDDLWNALGRPERITFPWTHKRSFLSMTPLGLDWTRRRIYRFLEQKLLPPPAATAASRATTSVLAPKTVCPGW